MLWPVLALCLAADLPVIVVDRDNVEVTRSCTLRFADAPIIDEDGNGVVHVRSAGHRLVVRCDGRLRGATMRLQPDQYTGTGISITGANVRLVDASVSGFKVAIHAIEADHLTIRNADVSDNFRRLLESTPQAEDSSDWLWPHNNDDNQWLDQYGAGICIEQSSHVTVRRCRARDIQNGLVLDAVHFSTVSGNDFSFLSGWGIALWRSSNNRIERNALDFCIRGYSHGVYNRGQDSAGLLMFEQCRRNYIAHNSMTHCGDGIFAFAGREALGEVNPRDDVDWYADRGNNVNIIVHNDCSFAAAHGIELTFSFDNIIAYNTIEGNAICGIWGGYSHRTHIHDNAFRDNGDGGYGLERGDVNIEHGSSNWIYDNEMIGSSCGVHLWWDEDPAILRLPWANANPTDSRDNVIYGNAMSDLDTAVHLRRTGVNRAAMNLMADVGTELDIDGESTLESARRDDIPNVQIPFRVGGIDESPLGRRSKLRGREHIIMTEWGPYDWQSVLVRRAAVDVSNTTRPILKFELLTGEIAVEAVEMVHQRLGDSDAARIPVSIRSNWEMSLPIERPGVHRVTITWVTDDGVSQEYEDVFAFLDWRVRWFNSPCDPREDTDAWRAGVENAKVIHMPQLRASFAGDGPGVGDVAADHFGTIATTSIELPAGRWRIRTTSDDGIRVWLNDEPAIDDWTWHAPRQHVHEFRLLEKTQIDLRVEHFELDGYAVLVVDLEPVDQDE